MWVLGLDINAVKLVSLNRLLAELEKIMAKLTPIQWCDSAVNPSMGCDGCELWSDKEETCYAGNLHVLRGGRPGYAPTFKQVTLFPGRMAEAARWKDLLNSVREDKPWLDGLPRLIFVSDMGDSLSKAVSFEYLEAEIISAVVSPEGSRHQWLWLTKRPERMAKFSKVLHAKGIEWPTNLWAGTSVTKQVTVSRVSHLLKVGGADTIRFLSVEPQREKIDLSAWLPKLDWVIQGGESGRHATPFNIEWASDMLGQCRSVGVPFFLKQLGAHVFDSGQRLRLKDGHGGDWAEWPIEVRVREMPKLPPRPIDVATPLRRRFPLC